ncbi:MAG: PKD domain-containing protein, partial [Methanoregula sp.]
WNWSFGDGSLVNATNQHPVHTYTNAGVYTVSLNATNAGGSDTTTRTNYITVTEPAPVANFTGTPTTGTVPLTVTFTDASTGNPTGWNWSFGDGSLVNATEQHPIHTYTSAGIYTVSLNATNAGGSDTTTRTNYITVTEPVPVANFSATPTTGTVPLTVAFMDISTGNPTRWNWSFGDGSLVNATEQHPVHTYTSAGIYTVSLNTTSAGGSDTTTRTNYITVTEPAPVANFTGTPTTGTVPLTVTFTDTSTNTPTGWNWSFGDGSLVNATEQHPVHTYTSAGVYTVSLNATSAGGSDTTTRTNYITVTEPAPVANFTGTPTIGIMPLTVTFTDVSTGNPTGWNWSFGDGSLVNATEQHPVHTYTRAGIYTVSLNATNAGGSDTTIRTNYITVTEPAPVANFSATPTTGTVPLTVTFTDSSNGNPIGWNWSFGDDSLVNATVQHPVHTYGSAGVYTVSLNATNAGGSDTTTRTNYITVTEPAPVANFTGTPTTGTVPLTVTFTDVSTGNPTRWNWSFGDGSLVNATVQHPVHTYGSAGVYTVSLNTTNAGGSDTTTRTNYITVTEPAPVANFSATPTTGIMPLTVTFTDVSTGNPTGWNWSFGDGSLVNATEQHPVHTYTSAGIYTVSLNATNVGGSSTKTSADYIIVTIPAPVANFSATPTTGTMPLTVTFTDASIGNPTGWNWSFGDDSLVNATVQHPVHTYANAGVYTVSLNATNAGGSDTTTRMNYITVTEPAPVANFTGTPTTGTVPLTVAFMDISTGNPTGWNWSFGDGSLVNATEQHPVHTYGSAGVYTVSLNTTNAGGSDTTTRTNYITVTEPAPVANFNATPTTGTVPLTVAFTDVSTGNPTGWNWSFGDGSLVNATDQHPVHTYGSAGVYTVSLNATNPGGSDTTTRTNYITVTAGPPPTASFSTNTTTIRTGGAVGFADNSTGNPVMWNWSFGDGNWCNTTIAGQTPAHTYETKGIYNAYLIVSNTNGANRSASQAIGVYDKPDASFIISPNPVSVNVPVQFTDTSAGSVTTWNWTFGDGSTSTEQNPTHAYPTAGNKTVTLAVGNPFETSPVTTNIVIVVTTDVRMSSDFIAGTTAPRTIQFNDTSASEMHAWNWSFGDGTYSGIRNPIHTFTENGTYRVIFSANNKIELRGTATADLTFGLAPVPAFTTNATQVYVNEGILFTDQSLNMVNFRIAPNWSWNFGDGSPVEYNQGPKTHAYTTAGTYTANLTVFNEVGGPVSKIQRILVNAKQDISLEIPNVNVSGGNITINQTQWSGGNFSFTNTSLTLYNLTQFNKVVITGTVYNISGNLTVNQTTNVALFTNPVNSTMLRGNVTTSLVVNMSTFDGTGMIDVVFGGNDDALTTVYNETLGTNTLRDVFVVLNITTVGMPTVTSSIINISVPYEWSLVYPSTTAGNNQNFTQILAIHNGFPSLLPTTYGGDYWKDGIHYAFYTAVGPGFSTFGLVGASSSASPPGPSPGPGGGGGGGGGGSGTFTGMTVTYGTPAQPAPAEAAVTKITLITGTGIAESGPVFADLAGLEGIRAAWSADIARQPDANATIITSIIQKPGVAVQNAYRTALQATNLDIAQIAYVMQVTKNGVPTIGAATISMDLPLNWINNYGGIDAIRIVRMGDDGTNEVLTTTFSNYDRDTGYLNFKAPSPKGLSTFGLVAVKAYIPGAVTPATTPVVTPTGEVTPVQPATGGLTPITIIGAVVIILVLVGIGIYFFTRKHE